MEANNRRDFLKKAALAGASALMAPTLLAAEGKDGSEFVLSPSKRTDSKLIVPKNNGLKITGTFLDEISRYSTPELGRKRMGSRLSAHEKDWYRYRYYDPFRISQVHHLSVQISIRKRMLYAFRGFSRYVLTTG